MNNTQHTPGPWEINPGTNFSYDKTEIATVYSMERMPTENGLGVTYASIMADRGDGASAAEQTANARLITAAPELLAECQRAFHVFENDTPRKCEVMGLFEAAIAKATGQAA